MQAPKAIQKNKVLTSNGHDRVDPFYWMNERDAPEVLAHIAEENKYTGVYFDQNQQLIDTLLDEYEARIDPNLKFAPKVINGLTYQWKNVAEKDYRELYVEKNGQFELFFDENERAENQTYYGLGDWSNSPNNELLAISEDFIGRRKYTIRFRDNSTKNYLDKKIENTDGSITWSNDNRTIYYVRKDETTLREFQVYKQNIGSNTSELIYEELDERFHVFVGKTFDNKFITLTSQSSTSSETWILSADDASEKPRCFLVRQAEHLYELDHHEKGFYFLSNWKSPNKQLLFSETIPSDLESCTVIAAHNVSIYLESFIAFQHYLIIQERKLGQNSFRYISLKNNESQVVAINESTAELGFAWNDDYFAGQFYYSFTSLTTPASIRLYTFDKQEDTLFFQHELLDTNFYSTNYISERVWARTNDGSEIPISLVYKKGIELNKAPLLLYGYGSYGITIPTNFSAYRLSLLDRGFVFAIAHIRGGKFLGEEWYQSGKLLKKRNTFSDFINCAEWLGLKGYCDSTKIFAQGGSAGGLLMGAVMNMAPHLFKGMIAQVPFVDVVTTMLDDTLPLTVGEYEEWGNPNESDSYWYMLSYSPYDHVKPIAYPALYITTGYQDSQVQYWEPMKWVAKLREMKTNKATLLFDCEMDAGHGGGSGRSTERLEVAKNHAFLLIEANVE